MSFFYMMLACIAVSGITDIIVVALLRRWHKR